MLDWRRELVLLGAVYVLEVVVFSSAFTGRLGTPSAVVVALYMGLLIAPLWWRHRAPAVVFAVVWLLAMVANLAVRGAHPTIVLLVAVAALARNRPAAWSIPAALLCCALWSFAVRESGDAVASPSLRGGAMFISALVYLVLTASAWGLGRWLGRNARRIADLEEQRRRAAERAVALERTRIARELHDIVAHAVTIMVLHAAGADRVLDIDPARARAAIHTVETTGAQAMSELRRLLGLLRNTGVASGEEDLHPPGLDHLPQLLDEVRDAGVLVTLEVTGTPVSLDPSVDAAAFRAAQEALTNVAKHAGPATMARLSLEWTTAALTVRVDNEGAAQPRTMGGTLSTGHGLLGLNERIKVVGGVLNYGPRPDGGYSLLARLPLANHSGEAAGGNSAPEPALRS